MANLGTIAALKIAINDRVFTNTSNEVSAEDVRSSFEDLIDTISVDTGVIDSDYTSLMSMKGAGTLVSGSFYAIDYVCTHVIPGTTEINTDFLPAVTEKIIVLATSGSALSGEIVSLQNPTDEIVWDSESALAEDGTTPRTGKVIYRRDVINNNSCHYDFRGAAIKRYQSAVAPWVTGSNYSRSDVVSDAGLFVAIRDWNNETEGVSLGHKWARIGAANLATSWLWANTVSVSGASLSSGNASYVRTFVSCKNCHIGSIDSAGGYNNISISSGTNITLGGGSSSASIENSSDINIRILTESTLSNSSIIDADKAQRTSMFACSKASYGEVSNGAMSSSDEIEVPNSANTYVSNCSGIFIGSKSSDTSVVSSSNLTIGINSSGNYFRNTSDSSFLNSATGNSVNGVRWSSFGNNINGFAFDPEANQSEVFIRCSVGDNCSGFSASINAIVSDTRFGPGCSSVTAGDGGTMSGCEFGAFSSNMTVASGGVMEKVMVGAGSDNFTIDNGGEVRDSKIGESSSGFAVNTSGKIESSVLGAKCTNVTVASGGIISDSDIGSGSSAITVTQASKFEKSTAGPSASVISLTVGASITESIFGGGSSITMADGSIAGCRHGSSVTININDSSISATTLGSFSQLTASGTSSIIATDIGDFCFGVSVAGGSQINDSDIGDRCSLITLDSSSFLNSVSVASINNGPISLSGTTYSFGEIKSRSGNITITNSNMEYVTFEKECTELILSSVSMTNCLFLEGYKNKTIDGSTGGAFMNAVSAKFNSTAETIDNISKFIDDVPCVVLEVLAGSSSIDFSNQPGFCFDVLTAGNLALTLDKTPLNKEIQIVAKNTSGAAATINIVDTTSASLTTVPLTANSETIFKIRRLMVSGANSIKVTQITEL